jgi:Uma2 family endonuclease
MVVKSQSFSRAAYARLIETGVLGEDDRIELLAGTVTAMSPIGPYHTGVLLFLIDFFKEALGTRASVSVQSPLALDNASEPQPDLLLLKRREDSYRAALPAPADVLLLIEVADASLELDLGEKVRLYARAWINEYWVVDLVRGRITVHRRPAGDRYEEVSEQRRGASIAPLAFPDTAVAVTACLG